MLSGKLKEHIEDIDRQAEDMFSQLVEQIKQVEGITEQLKATDQLEWVRRMNSIRNRTEEIVKSEVLFIWQQSKTFGIEKEFHPRYCEIKDNDLTEITADFQRRKAKIDTAAERIMRENTEALAELENN